MYPLAHIMNPKQVTSTEVKIIKCVDSVIALINQLGQYPRFYFTLIFLLVFDPVSFMGAMIFISQ